MSSLQTTNLSQLMPWYFVHIRDLPNLYIISKYYCIDLKGDRTGFKDLVSLTGTTLLFTRPQKCLFLFLFSSTSRVH